MPTRERGHDQGLPARMELPEYLELFGKSGEFAVRVRFVNPGASIPERRLPVRELDQLLVAEGGLPVTRMTFDEWPGEIERYEIDLVEKVVTLFVRVG